MCSQQCWSSYFKTNLLDFWTHAYMETCSLWEATLKFSLYCWLNFSWGHSKALSKEEPSWARYTAVSPKMAISKKWILESKRGPTHMVPEPLHMSVSIRFNLQKQKETLQRLENGTRKSEQSLFFLIILSKILSTDLLNYCSRFWPQGMKLLTILK